MSNRYIIDRGLPERSKLQFFFPAEVGTHVVTLPFFENPKISERKKARYQSYSMVSRSSNMYSYLGADSRVFSLQFNMTLNHIADSGEINLERYLPILRGHLDSDIERARFFEPQAVPNDGSYKAAERHAGRFYSLLNVKDSAAQVLHSEFMQLGLNTQSTAIEALKERYGIGAGIDDDFGEINDIRNQRDGIITSLQGYSTGSPTNNAEGLLPVVDLIIYWVNIIRSSVVNNSRNPLYGPPIIRLTHGIMYEDVPCICRDYTLAYNEAAGYDLETLLPRQLQITMKLEETRTGDFGEFNAHSQYARQRDNLAGWEAVISKSTRSMDPGSGGRIA